jgi:hypothetical protein
MPIRSPVSPQLLSVAPMKCHPARPGLPWDRSVAKWRDLLFRFTCHHPPAFSSTNPSLLEAPPSPLSSRPERSVVEGSAVPRTSPGNVFENQ